MTDLHRRLAHAEAANIADQIASELARCQTVSRFEIAGSLRRGTPTCGDLDIVAAASDSELARDEIESVFRDLAEIGRTVHVAGVGTKIVLGSFREHAIKWEVWLVPPSHYGATLNWTTGSREHNRAVRLWCLMRGYKLPIGIHRIGKSRRFRWLDREIFFNLVFKAKPASDQFESEEEFYNSIQLSWIPPGSRSAGLRVIWDAHQRWRASRRHTRLSGTYEHKGEGGKIARS